MVGGYKVNSNFSSESIMNFAGQGRGAVLVVTMSLKYTASVQLNVLLHGSIPNAYSNRLGVH